MSIDFFTDYINERLGKQTFKTDKGFVIYYFCGDATCFLEDLYVAPEFRRKKAATDLADEITRIARAKGCVQLVCTVFPLATNATDSLKAILSYGFELSHITKDGLIMFTKDLED